MLARQWCSGMITSSSTLRSLSGEGHKDMFRMLHALLHDTEAVVYSNQRELQPPHVCP